MDDNIFLTNLQPVDLDIERIPKKVELINMTKPERMAYQRLLRKQWKLRHRKKYTRKAGHVHPKKKEATKRRKTERLWRENPFGCLLSNKYSCKRLSRERWNELIMPYWSLYDPADLRIKRLKKDVKGELYGTRKNPITIYSLQLIHKKLGMLYNGQDQELYDLSKGAVQEET